MKIAVERLEQVSYLCATQQEASARNKATVPGQELSGKDKESSLQVTLSNTISQINTDTSGDINMESVNQIKAQISAGKLPIDTDVIARQLVSDIFNFS